MGKARPHEPVKIITGLITSDDRLFASAAFVLKKKLGPIDIESEVFPFNHTSYYEEEMGNNLKRKFLSFHRLMRPDGVEGIKIFTNGIENKFLKGSKRSINIDPGYLAAGKLVLLTTKNYSHRVYLKKGIYAESTLYFKNNDYLPWEWSYPDYKTEAYRNFFRRVRGIYMEQIKND